MWYSKQYPCQTDPAGGKRPLLKTEGNKSYLLVGNPEYPYSDVGAVR